MGFRGLGRVSLQATCYQCYPASLLILFRSCCSCLAALPGAQAAELGELQQLLQTNLLGLHQLLTPLLKIYLRASLSLPLPPLVHLVRPEQEQNELLN